MQKISGYVILFAFVVGGSILVICYGSYVILDVPSAMNNQIM